MLTNINVKYKEETKKGEKENRRKNMLNEKKQITQGKMNENI